MFYFINHNKLNVFFLTSLIIVNLSILFLNKKNFFYHYKNEVNFYATEIDRSKFYKHQFTIIDYIKEQLGIDYKFRNFKITGPNFSKIEFRIKNYKNKKKTDYINSTYLLTFSISSTDKENLDYITQSVKTSFPIVMNFLNSLDLLNYLSFIDWGVEFICYNKTIDFKIDKNKCSKMENLFDNIQAEYSGIDAKSFIIGDIPINDTKKIENIKKNIFELKELFKSNSDMKKNFPIYYKETIKFLSKGEQIVPDTITKLGRDVHRIVEEPIEVSNLYENYANKVIVYANLLLLLIMFGIKYLILVSTKK
jgi:hypothetical protein